MFRYAQITASAPFTVVAVGDYSMETIHPQLIDITARGPSFNPLGWTYIDGEFVEPPPPAEPESE
jgi:hypothetical protein